MHYVYCQYANHANNGAYNQLHNQFNKENEASNNYMRDIGDANNQQQSRSYQSEYKV